MLKCKISFHLFLQQVALGQVVPSCPPTTLESGVRHPRSKQVAPSFSVLTRSELEQHAPGFSGLNGSGTDLDLEPHCGDDPLGATATKFRTGRDVAIT